MSVSGRRETPIQSRPAGGQVSGSFRPPPSLPIRPEMNRCVRWLPPRSRPCSPAMSMHRRAGHLAIAKAVTLPPPSSQWTLENNVPFGATHRASMSCGTQRWAPGYVLPSTKPSRPMPAISPSAPPPSTNRSSRSANRRPSDSSELLHACDAPLLGLAVAAPTARTVRGECGSRLSTE